MDEVNNEEKQETGVSNNPDLEGNVSEEKESQNRKDMLALIRSEADLKITAALKEQKKEFERELKKQKQQPIKGAEQESAEEHEQTIVELQEQLALYKLANTKAEISKVLSNRGLDVNLVDFVVNTDDIAECIPKVDALEKLFKDAVKKEVSERLKSSPPKSAAATPSGITREAFMRMSVSKQQELYETNKDLYLELTKQR